MLTKLPYWICRVAVGATASLAIHTLAFAGDVGVSVNLNLPGVYGQVTLGDLPTPELIMARPVVAVPAPVVIGAPPPPPLYLHVPPGHERHWEKHCREYNACGRPVYFVSDRWYRDVYTPRHHAHEGEHEGYRHDEHYRHEEHEHERREHEHHEDRGHGHDHDH